MAMVPKNVLLILALISFFMMATATRNNNNNNLHIKPGYNLAARLEASGGLTECWNALLELKSCSNEIILFFLNGQTSLGPACCSAIDIITRNCWPAMLTSLGFTAEEGNILRAYCEVPSGPAAAPPVSASSKVLA